MARTLPGPRGDVEAATVNGLDAGRCTPARLPSEVENVRGQLFGKHTMTTEKELESLRAALAHERQRSSELERRAALLEETVRRAYRRAANTGRPRQVNDDGDEPTSPGSSPRPIVDNEVHQQNPDSGNHYDGSDNILGLAFELRDIHSRVSAAVGRDECVTINLLHDEPHATAVPCLHSNGVPGFDLPKGRRTRLSGRLNRCHGAASSGRSGQGADENGRNHPHV